MVDLTQAGDGGKQLPLNQVCEEAVQRKLNKFMSIEDFDYKISIKFYHRTINILSTH